MSDSTREKRPPGPPPPLPPRPSVRPLPSSLSSSSAAPSGENSSLSSHSRSSHDSEPSRRLDSNVRGRDHSSSSTSATQLEDDLSEAKLRELYENEEIERFFQFFSAHVSEVRLLDSALIGSRNTREDVQLASVSEKLDTPSDDDDSSTANKDGDPLFIPNSPNTSTDTPSLYASAVNHGSLSENIAYNYVIPALPPPRPVPPFTLSRLQLTLQRLFLIAESGYLPFLLRLKHFATWENRNESFVYCSAYWILWYHNLLLPAFFVYLMYILLDRRFKTHPTASELRERRREVLRAREFGDAMQTRMAISSPLGLKDVWKLRKLLWKPKTKKPKIVQKGKADAGDAEKSGIDINEGADLDADQTTIHAEILEAEVDELPSGTTEDTIDDVDVRKIGLKAMTELADLQERLKNIFLWKRPNATRVYFMLIALLFVVTLLLPAQYLAKTIYFTVGFIFWHIIPVVAVIPSAELGRLPQPLSIAPTDAEYAMDLISRRVAQGLPVLPPRTNAAKTTATQDHLNGSSQPDSNRGHKTHNSGDSSVDWKKWAGRAATGKNWAADAKSFVTKNQRDDSPLASRLSSSNTEIHTFPAHHTKSPGLITLTPSTFYFTPVISVRPTVTIECQDITGIKKAGLMKGLIISWCRTDSSGNTRDEEEKFRWVGGRDEVFARLLGPGGRRWIKTIIHANSCL